MADASPHTRALPGDAPQNLARMLRIDHAGEYGAKRIYAGQIAVLKDMECAPALREMEAQEAVHLARFETLLPQHKVRPTALLPLWHIAGYALGALTGFMGPRAAMACTVAVESVITEHYDRQLAEAEIADAGLKPTIQKFRDEEQEHHDLGIASEAQSAPFYEALTGVIKAGCRGAIWLSARI